MMKELGMIMSEATAYMKSRIILTAAELDIFTRIHEKPAGLVALAQEMVFDKRAMTRVHTKGCWISEEGLGHTPSPFSKRIYTCRE
jgi:hypothetical protein